MGSGSSPIECSTNKYCNQTCQAEFRKKEIFKLIEQNSLSKYSSQNQSRWVKKYLIEKYGENKSY